MARKAEIGGIGIGLIGNVFVMLIDKLFPDIPGTILWFGLGLSTSLIIFCLGLILWPKKREPATETVRVESHDQSGGLTAGIIRDSQVTIGTEPEFSRSQWEHTRIEQGHGYRAILTVKAQYSVPHLRVTVHAPSIQSLRVQPYPIGGIWSSGGSHEGDGYCQTTIYNAAGEYLVQVVTEEPEEPQAVSNEFLIP